jgi:CheY-like chemotaxis protein
MGSASSALAECPACEHSQSILGASERAAYLTRQLLAYAGKGTFITKLVDLTEMVSKSKQLLSAAVPKRAGLHFRLSKGLPLLESDPSRLEQIVMNLVVNAGEAIPAKTDGLIEISTSTCEVTPELARRQWPAYEAAAGPHVCLEVRDNGCGMDQATLSRIFDPFFSTKFTGRGLGLAAVHGIVRSSRGFIESRSSPGGGTTFRVFLPASDKKPPAELPMPAVQNQAPGTATILVVDDEEMVRRLACLVLRRHGYHVREAENGKDALDVLGQGPDAPSVALVDLAMPVMGGDELLPLVRARYPELKIIVSSGYPEEEARKISANSPVAGYSQKPYTAVALTEKVAQVLQL